MACILPRPKQSFEPGSSPVLDPDHRPLFCDLGNSQDRAGLSGEAAEELLNRAELAAFEQNDEAWNRDAALVACRFLDHFDEIVAVLSGEPRHIGRIMRIA